jgi:hypothetical protein
MAGKPGFMMYHGKVRVLAKMDAESFKTVMMAICDYSEFGAEPTALNDTEAMAFDMMREAIDRDNDKYLKRVEAGRKGGVASGEARRSIAKQNEANEPMRSKMKQNEANEPTQPNVNPTSTQHQPNPTSGNSSNSYEGGGEEEAIPPTVEEVEEVIREKGLDVDAREFLERCEANGWKDGKGRPVINWRTWLTGYALKAAKPAEGGAARLRPDPRLAAFEAMKGGRA